MPMLSKDLVNAEEILYFCASIKRKEYGFTTRPDDAFQCHQHEIA